MELTKEELQTIINLLFAGKFGFSAQENDKVIVPIINKLSKMMDVVIDKIKPEKVEKDATQKDK